MSNAALPPGISDFISRAEAGLSKLRSLDRSIRDLSGASWSRELERSAETDSPLSDLGAAKLSGEISAAVHLTKIGRPPLEAADFDGDPGESATAWASLLLAGKGGVGLQTSQPVSGGSLSAGVDASGAVTLAQHRRFSQAKKALGALVDVLGDFTVPYDVGRVKQLTDGDVLVCEISGSAVLRADASWTYGLVRELAGEQLEDLEIQEPVAIKAGATIGLTVNAGIEGKLRVVVRPSPKATPDRKLVQVELFKHRGDFVGAGLEISAGLSIENVEAFIDSVLAQLLRIPDQLVEEIDEVSAELADLRKRLDALQDDAKAAIAEAAGKAEEALGLDDLQRLSARLDEQRPEVRDLLAPLARRIDGIQSRFQAGRADLEKFVDDLFAEANQPLDRAESILARWRDGYARLRERAANFVKSRATQGIQLEMAAGINRSHANDALLDLEFDLDLAADLYRQAVRGNFSPALQAARAHGANGVELNGGTLKETTRLERSLNLTLTLFGFQVKRDLKSWSQVEVGEDLVSGSLNLVGQVGASLASEVGQTARTLSFIFDLTSGAERRDGKVYLTDPRAGYRATLVRTASMEKGRAIRRAVPLHVNGAVGLGKIDPDSAVPLRDKLLAAEGAYGYDLTISFPPAAIQRVFLLERAREGSKQVRPLVWDAVRRAVLALDMLVPAEPEDCELSKLMVQSAIDEIRRQPNLTGMKRFRAPRIAGTTLAPGADRLVWSHIFESHLFIEAYLEARETLIAGKPVGRINRDLRKLARRIRKTIGSLGSRPVDAKYLALALLAGVSQADVNLTFKRGDTVAVTL